jgi:putative glutathione S-transferase
MFYTAFDALLPPALRSPTLDFYPSHLRGAIDEMIAWIYDLLNNAVYKAGFATTQPAYDSAITSIFSALDRLEAHLSSPTYSGPYLFGSSITEADIRVYPTLIRFDVAYHTIFKCNLKMIRHDYPKLHDWMRGLYWGESKAFRDTVDFQAVSAEDGG